MRFLDCLAAVIALTLLGALIVSPFLDVEMPDDIRTAFGLSMGWVFKGAANGINGAVHRRRNNGNRKD